ncbi:PH, RCC1 and FYVE domains-containing protein 1 isoform X1 [Pistacia vera]|uniref:PH, RCC1 and FYVE domains-containing protein 1 isoform X1 n=1 Tax=Pistacia vera TaxID=55513 RepID=UPI0012633967|nr:PH, RCC1 and FYVE domains-containing protein 1 isoform X1 [Pistacia vera]
MANFQQNILIDRDVDQAIRVLKKGTYLLKYGRWGKPKFCPFKLSTDETLLIWYAGKDEKQLKLSLVSRIIPGQRTAIFQRYPQPEKEYQSFSLIYSNRSLDLICKDKDEAELWFTALRALISPGNYRKSKSEATIDSISSDSPFCHTQKNSLCSVSSTSTDIIFKNSTWHRLGKSFSEVLSYTAAAKAYSQAESFSKSLSFVSFAGLDETSSRSFTVDSYRASLSSAVSSSSQGCSYADFEALVDVFFWGEGVCGGLLGGGLHEIGISSPAKRDALWPKVLESNVVLDAQNVACGSKHAVLVTKQGQIFSWGEGSGGRLGHGVETDVSYPKLIDALNGSNIHLVACGEFHTCAATISGDLYTWGDGTHNLGLLGHVSEVSCWTPKKVSGQMEGVQVSSISCGPWHTAAVTSAGKLFTFGDGTFGALGHGDRSSTSVPREVETLREQRTEMASCGVWHTAAIVGVTSGSSSFSGPSSRKLFTWGDGADGQLGHGDEEPRLVPDRVAVSEDTNFCKVACGHSITIALTDSGQIYSMGSANYGQLGSPGSTGKIPTRIEGNIRNTHIEDIACGSYHIAVLSSKAEVYTWGKGANGQLGHGDNENRNSPKIVEALRNKQVKTVVCGSNLTAAICLHKSVSNADYCICSGCQNSFNFRRKRHNCYNCGLAFCKVCSSKRSLKAALAPDINKPYRVCDDCFSKLNRASESRSISLECRSISQSPNCSNGSINQNWSGASDKENMSSRSVGPLLRLTSFDSFKEAKGGQSKLNSHSCHGSPSINGTFQWESASAFRHSNKISTCLPGSRMVSRPPSPISWKSGPFRSMTMNSAIFDLAKPEITFDESKQTNDCPNQETVILRAQVEDLTHQSRLLKVELERTSRQLKEKSATAQQEAEKNKASQEVIRSLTAQSEVVLEQRCLSNIFTRCKYHCRPL